MCSTFSTFILGAKCWKTQHVCGEKAGHGQAGLHSQCSAGVQNSICASCSAADKQKFKGKILVMEKNWLDRGKTNWFPCKDLNGVRGLLSNTVDKIDMNSSQIYRKNFRLPFSFHFKRIH